MTEVVLLLGSNLGNRQFILNTALGKITTQVGKITDKSTVYETAPWGFEANKSFLNQVIRVKTKLGPNELLFTLLSIEQELGRTRNKNKYQSRIIDIDILLFDNLIINEKNLTIPHPRLHERMFTLIPLAEIAGNHIHPGFGITINTLLFSCKDKSAVNVYHKKTGQC